MHRVDQDQGPQGRHRPERRIDRDFRHPHPASEIVRLEGEKKDIDAQAATASNERERTDYQQQIKGIDDQIKYNQTTSASVGNLAEEVISILKKRRGPQRPVLAGMGPDGQQPDHRAMPGGGGAAQGQGSV